MVVNVRACILPVVLLGFGACSDPAQTPAAPDPVVVEEAPAESVPEEETPPEEGPELRVVVDRVHETRSVELTLDNARSDIEVRMALGPVAPGCDSGTRVGLGSDGATHRAEGLPLRASVSVCILEDDGRVRARSDVVGWRGPVAARFYQEGDDFSVRFEVEPLDDDVDALVFVAGPVIEDAGDPLRCAVETGYGPDDDPPEHCIFACEGRVVAEVPRAVVERLIASPAYRPRREGGRFIRPATFGIEMPLELRANELPRACVRTRDGMLESERGGDTFLIDEPWNGCDWDTPSGACTYVSGVPEVGSELLGETQGRRVSARVRRARMQRNAQVMDVVAGGRHVHVAANEALLGADGIDVLGRDLRIGSMLRYEGGPLRVDAIDEAQRMPWPRVDVEGATHFFRNGFLVHDIGRDETSEAPTLAPAPFAAGPGPGDCSLEASWVASRTTSPTSLAARSAEGAPRFARADANCDTPVRTVDVATLAAVASLDAEAEIIVRLFGGAIDCDEEYHVSLCADGVDAPALWAESTPWCLPAGTLIDTPRGPRAIETLSLGDQVRSFDGRETVATVLGHYTHEDRALYEVRLDDGRLLEATAEHLVMVGAHFLPRPVSALRPGDQLHVRVTREQDGASKSETSGETQSVAVRPVTTLEAHTVLSVEPGRRARVYELRVSSPDTYFANGVLVHNY